MSGFLDPSHLADSLTADPPAPEDLKPGDLLAIRVTRHEAASKGYWVGGWYIPPGHTGYLVGDLPGLRGAQHLFKPGLFLGAAKVLCGERVGDELDEVRVMIDADEVLVSPADIACVMARPR